MRNGSVDCDIKLNLCQQSTVVSNEEYSQYNTLYGYLILFSLFSAHLVKSCCSFSYSTVSTHSASRNLSKKKTTQFILREVDICIYYTSSSSSETYSHFFSSSFNCKLNPTPAFLQCATMHVESICHRNDSHIFDRSFAGV